MENRNNCENVRKILREEQRCYYDSEPEKASKEPLVGNDGLLWPATFDADVWAAEFCNRNTAADKDMIRSWFANAIMRGYDAANLKNEKDKQEKAKHEIVNAMSCIPKLHLEKVFVSGKKAFRLVAFENMPRKGDLPREYSDGNCFFVNDAGTFIRMLYKSRTGVYEDSTFYPNLLIHHKHIEMLKACYKRLSKIKIEINKKLKEYRPERFVVTF